MDTSGTPTISHTSNLIGTQSKQRMCEENVFWITSCTKMVGGMVCFAHALQGESAVGRQQQFSYPQWTVAQSLSNISFKSLPSPSTICSCHISCFLLKNWLLLIWDIENPRFLSMLNQRWHTLCSSLPMLKSLVKLICNRTNGMFHQVLMLRKELLAKEELVAWNAIIHQVDLHTDLESVSKTTFAVTRPFLFSELANQVIRIFLVHRSAQNPLGFHVALFSFISPRLTLLSSIDQDFSNHLMHRRNALNMAMWNLIYYLRSPKSR